METARMGARRITILIHPRSLKCVSEVSVRSDAGLKTMTPPELRELVRRLLACDATAGKTPEPSESATLRVYEELRQSLDGVVGVTAFQLLASRALAMAKEEAPSLGTVHIAANGSLLGLIEHEPQNDNDMDRAGDGGILLIAHLVGLLHTFLGEALTISLLRNAWPGASFDDRDSGNGRNA
jgi:hypothetical protein